jgi:hypothetical protein
MFFKKKKKNQKVDKRLVIFLSILFVFLLVIIFTFILSLFAKSSDVKVSTDKIKYKNGEVVNIKILNKKDAPIFYKKVVDRVWELQKLEKGEWNGSMEVIFEDGGKYFLEDKVKNSDGTCRIVSDSSNIASSLQTGEEISIEWDQMGCPAVSRGKEAFIKRIEEGTYRICFTFSYKTIGENGNEIIVPETAYSQPFKIK